MHHLQMTKPDGRALTLYGREPVVVIGPATMPNADATVVNPHLRWHPLRGEWVAYAAHRQNRTHLPPPEYDPLSPSKDDRHPTELPPGNYDVAVFDNLFPSLVPTARDPPSLGIPTAPANGDCEVVVFTPDSNATLGQLELTHIELLLRVWGHRTKLLGDRDRVQYVMPFENRGVEVGVTLHHAHGQIYAYPFIPPVPARMNGMEVDHFVKHGQPLLQSLIEAEVEQGIRVLYVGEHAVAFVPPWARYSYEVCVAPRRAAGFLHELDDLQLRDLARALKTTLMKFDGLWGLPLPYLMAWFQAPTDGRPHPESHVHAEFYPPYRTRDKLKYLAGTELAAGMFANDSLPEERASELQRVQVGLGS